MPYPIIPIFDQRLPKVMQSHGQPSNPPTDLLQDLLGRALRELRISVTDRCNFRCRYCMPRETFHTEHAFLGPSQLLSFDEITQLAAALTSLGVEKIRLTGGEPLLRKNLETLIASLGDLRTIHGKPLDLALTTNGSALRHQARALRAAGLRRITVSLDAMDEAVFQRMSDAASSSARQVLQGIDAAVQAGFEQIKVNMVVQRGVNDDQILPMARHFRRMPISLRFIEYMDVGGSLGWHMAHVVPSTEVLECLRNEFELEPLAPQSPSETAQRWRHAQGGGEIGLISSVTQAFCGECTRARLSPEGQLYLCLFAHQGHDLRQLLRSGRNHDEITAAIQAIWSGRADRYSQLRGQDSLTQRLPKVEMHYIGG